MIPPRVLSPLPPEPEEPPSPEQPEPATPVARRPSAASDDDPAAHGCARQPRELRAPRSNPRRRRRQPGPQEAPAEAKPDEPKTAALKTPQTANEDESARRIREVMSRAQKELTRVNATALGRDARVQYDTARRFIDQAEDALKVKNYMFAGYLADKAEQLRPRPAGSLISAPALTSRPSLT